MKQNVQPVTQRKRQSNLSILLQKDNSVYKTMTYGYIIIRIVLLKLRQPAHILTFLYKSVFLLRNLSPDSMITYPHIFLSFSYSFLLVSCWWLSYSYRRFLPPWEYHNIHTTLSDPDPEVRSSGTLQWTSMYPSARPELQNSFRYCSCALSEMFYDLQNPRFFVVLEWV